MDRRSFIKLSSATLAASLLSNHQHAPYVYSDLALSTPGWLGSLLAPTSGLANWSTEQDSGSSASLSLVDGLEGSTVALDWNIGSGSWVQGKYTFSTPLDLSAADLFGVSLYGDESAAFANTVSFMFADVNHVFYGCDLIGKDFGVNQVGRWINNLALPKKLL